MGREGNKGYDVAKEAGRQGARERRTGETRRRKELEDTGSQSY